MRRPIVMSKSQTTIRVHPGTRALKGALASTKGKGMPFSKIRASISRGLIR
ncbi:MAG: hypothetical protein WCJ97_09250 [Phycisphaerae bacterium]